MGSMLVTGASTTGGGVCPGDRALLLLLLLLWSGFIPCGLTTDSADAIDPGALSADRCEWCFFMCSTNLSDLSVSNEHPST